MVVRNRSTASKHPEGEEERRREMGGCSTLKICADEVEWLPLHAVSIAIAALLFRSLKDERWYVQLESYKPVAH